MRLVQLDINRPFKKLTLQYTQCFKVCCIAIPVSPHSQPSLYRRKGVLWHSSEEHFAVSLFLRKGELLIKFELNFNFYSKVKPLGVIWGKFSEFYSKKNTIMFDDIGRNFLMNPQNGLKVRHNFTCYVHVIWSMWCNFGIWNM